MSRIGKKIFLSYILIVLISLGLSMTITKMNFSNNLNEKIRDELRRDANQISFLIHSNLRIDLNPQGIPLMDMYSVLSSEDTVIESIRNVIYTAYRTSGTNIGFYNRDNTLLFTTNYYIQDEEDRARINNNINNDSHMLKEERDIRNPYTGEYLGRIIANTEKKNLGEMNTLINNAFFSGLAISFFLVILLALLFERNLIAPINKLKRNMKNFSIEGDNAWEYINTKDEIADLNNEFRNMAKELIRNNKKQKEFFQNTSHELKTPLMSIQGYAEAIKFNIVPEEEIEDSLNIIIDETNKLTETVNSIVYISKLDKLEDMDNKDDIQKIDVQEFVQEIADRFNIILEDRQVQVLNKVESEIYLEMKEDHLYRILTNLITNAERYAKSSIQIEGRQTEDTVILRVIDDGTGFDESEIDNVFDRFFKGMKGNSGLGLSIVKSTVEQYNGFVLAYNHANGGACIEIDFPIFQMKKDAPKNKKGLLNQKNEK